MSSEIDVTQSADGMNSRWTSSIVWWATGLPISLSGSPWKSSRMS